MNKIILDRTTLTKLGTLDHAVELCDETGRTLGYFRPADTSEYEGIHIPISDEELRQRERETGGFTTAQVLDHLNSLPGPETG